jgi:predicted ABC-type ATPase
MANREAIYQMNIFIANKKSFGFESNLADNETWKFIESIKNLGYDIYINYYGVDDLNICIKRVSQRVKEGGHDVREDIIRQRYDTSLKLLKIYKNLPNTLILTDNSTYPKQFAILNNGNIFSIEENLPIWVKSIFTDVNLPQLKFDDKTIEEVKMRYKNKFN